MAEEFSESQITQIREKSAPIRTVEPVKEVDLDRANFSDLKRFKSIVGDSKVIALGEATHGTSEFFKVKHRLLQFAIEELGVRVFILEDNQLLTERINSYVLYGTGKAEEVIKGLFAVWSTTEMLEMIKWIRSFNQAHPGDMVEFVGMDVQNPQLAFDYLGQFLAKRNKEVLARSNDYLTDIQNGWRNSFFQSDSALTSWHEKAEKNFDLINKHRDVWLQNAKNESDSTAVAWCIQNAGAIVQFVETALGGVFEGRDKAMADNVEWVINQRRPNTKVLIWAHDSHVSRGDAKEPTSNFFFGKSMGSYLSKKFKEDYKAFGLFTYQGNCLGTISYSNFDQVDFNLYTSPKGSLDEALHQVSGQMDEDYLLFDLRPFKTNHMEYQWLNQKRPVRYVGYVAEDYGFGGRYSIPSQFDGIIFVDKSVASTKL